MRGIAVFLVILVLLQASAAVAAPSPSSPLRHSTALIFGADVAAECSAKCVLTVEASRSEGTDAVVEVEQTPLRLWNTLTLPSGANAAYRVSVNCPGGCWAAAATEPVSLWPPPTTPDSANASTGPLTYTLLSEGSPGIDGPPRVYRVDLKGGAAEERLLTVHHVARPLCDAVCAHRAALRPMAVAWVVLCPALGWLAGGLWMRPRSGTP